MGGLQRQGGSVSPAWGGRDPYPWCYNRRSAAGYSVSTSMHSLRLQFLKLFAKGTVDFSS